MSRGTENAAGERQAERHRGVKDGDSVFLGLGPVLGILWVVWSIPADEIGLLLRLPSVHVTMVSFIVILWPWIALFDVLLDIVFGASMARVGWEGNWGFAVCCCWRRESF